MKAEDSWTTYRTRFLVKAKQLTTCLTFTDVLGRQHCGVKGDYLVESSDGVLRIAPRQFFEDVYVPLSEGSSPPPASKSTAPFLAPISCHVTHPTPKLSLSNPSPTFVNAP